MSKNQFRFSKIEIHVLKVHMNCQGCMERVRKLLKRIEDIDAEEQKVTIIGNVDSSILIKKLAKLGKQAQLWASTSKQDEDDEEQTLRKNKGNYLEDAIDPSYTFQNEYMLPIFDSEFNNPTLLECYLAQENSMSSGFRHGPVSIAAAQKARGPMVSMTHDVADIQDYQFS
ncbi:Heavy metal-associated isoprenylated plant protein 32, partial [Cucurbita argyrosperma subsp. argyrosperma]